MIMSTNIHLINMLYKSSLAQKATLDMNNFCEINHISVPVINYVDKNNKFAPSKFGVCAYYRKNTITLELIACARVGLGGREWSFPHYRIDRTPYGVIAHELGHHIDFTTLNNEQRKEFEVSLIGSQKITNYEANIRESFAETFRLYFTNPNLLKVWSPERFYFMKKYWVSLYIDYSWEEILLKNNCPERQISQIKKHI